MYIPDSCICFPTQTLFKKTNRSESYAFKHCYHIPRKNVPIIMISATLCWVIKTLGKCDFLTIFVKIIFSFCSRKLNYIEANTFSPQTSCGGTTVSLSICEAVTISCLHRVTSKSPGQNCNSS